MVLSCRYANLSSRSMFIQSLIEAHQTYNSAYPIYFYCSRTTAEPERSNPEEILRSLMRQASDLPGGPPLHIALRNRYDRRRIAGDVSAEEATDIILHTIKDRRATYIVIDALDECNRDTRGLLIEALEEILTRSASLVKIFVTSRNDNQDISLSLHQYPQVHINASRNQEDIELYVQVKVDEAIRKRRLLPSERVTADLEQEIKESLRKGAKGM